MAAASRFAIGGRSFGDYMDQIRHLYEPQLTALSLGESQIEQQSLSELKESLDRIGEAISHPEQFGTFGLTFTAEVSVIISRTPSEGTVTVGALPLLLQRKKMILDRIRILSPDEQLGDVREVVEDKVDDPAVKEQLISMLSSYAAEQTALAEEAQRSGRSALDSAMLEIELKERKWRMRRSMVEREPVAILIGAVILVALAIALITAMFTKTTAPEILANAFLLILGYFFGQSTSSGRPNDGQMTARNAEISFNGPPTVATRSAPTSRSDGAPT